MTDPAAASPSAHQPQTSALDRKDALLRQARDFAEDVHSGEWAGSPTRRDELVNAIDAELSAKEPK
jgi:glucose-6-phosphate isomerase